MGRGPTTKIFFEGREWTVYELAQEYGLSYHTVRNRLRHGDTGERLVRPVGDNDGDGKPTAASVNADIKKDRQRIEKQTKEVGMLATCRYRGRPK